MSLRKCEERGYFFIGDIVDEGADGSGFFEPIALPERTGSYALVGTALVVEAAGHGSPVDGVDY